MHLLLFYFYIYTISYYILFMVGLFGLYFRIFIIGIAFNIINIYFNIFIFSIINIFIFNIINDILISYDCTYVKHLRTILIDQALYK